MPGSPREVFSLGDPCALFEVDLCGVAIGEEGLAQGQELTCLAVAVGVGAVAEGLGQASGSMINGHIYHAP